MATSREGPVRVAAATLAVLLLALLVPIEPAFACSCASHELGESLRQDDAVVVVTRVLRPGEAPRGFASTELTLRVDVRLKGDVPPFVTVEGDDGGSCRPYVAPHHVAALALTRDRDHGWRAEACSMLWLPDVLPALGLPPVTGTDPAALLLTGPYGRGTTAALVDERGAVLAWGRGEVPAVLVDVCPGGHTSLEVGTTPEGQLVVTTRRLPDLEVLATEAIARPGSAVLSLDCRAEDGSRAAVVASSTGEPRAQTATVWHRDQGGWTELVTRSAQSVAALAGDHAFLVVEQRPGTEMATWTSELVTVELATGAVAGITTLGRFPVVAIEVADDGTVALTGYAGEQMERRVIDLATRAELERTTFSYEEFERTAQPCCGARLPVGDQVVTAGGPRLTVTGPDGATSSGGPIHLAVTTAGAALGTAGPITLVATDEPTPVTPEAVPVPAGGADAVVMPAPGEGVPWVGWLIGAGAFGLLSLVVLGVRLRRRHQR